MLKTKLLLKISAYVLLLVNNCFYKHVIWKINQIIMNKRCHVYREPRRYLLSGLIGKNILNLCLIGIEKTVQ